MKPFTKSWHDQVNDHPKKPRSPQDYAKLITEYGYAVIPIYGTRESKNEKHAEFLQTLNEMPEYLEPPGRFKGEVHYVKGGFGALGNASSFHNPFVRQVRMDAYNMVLPVLQSIQQETKLENVEEIIDRMRVLRPKAQIMAESWHRDTTPKKYLEPEGALGPQDLIFGGWINFDAPGSSGSQQFSAFAKSHKTLPASLGAQEGKGFEKASPEQVLKLGKSKGSM